MTKQQTYQQLLPQIKAVVAGERDVIANMANTAAALHEAFGFWWTGFYRVDGETLVLGPYQGTLACTRIPFGRGVCGAAWEQNKTIIVPNVHEFAGHIACSSASNSEIVVPIRRDGRVIAVLDIDSTAYNTFDATDQLYLEQIAEIVCMTDATHIPDSLKQYIEQVILPEYDAFDGGHRRDHALMVINESLKLAREHGADERMAYTIAAYHDLGLRYDRETHHLHSGKILLADQNLRRWFTEEQLLVMRDAVEDHRAIGKNPPRTIYGAIVAEADRQIVPEVVVHRTMAYSRKLMPDADFETLYQRSKEHLLEKYAEGGYMHLWLNSERNVRGLEHLRALIRDEAHLRKLCKEWFDSH